MLRDVFEFFKDLMEALGEARASEAEELESLRELDRRLGEISSGALVGKLGPRDPFVPGHHSHERRKVGNQRSTVAALCEIPEYLT
jgi:hypothetical protein